MSVEKITDTGYGGGPCLICGLPDFDCACTYEDLRAELIRLREIEALAAEWMAKAVQYQSVLRGIARDRSVSTLANARACARSVLARLDGAR